MNASRDQDETSVLVAQLRRENARLQRLVANKQALLEKAHQEQSDTNAMRRAMLYLLEDLEENRRETEHARREWSSVFDAIPDLIFVHDAQYRIVRANQAYVKTAGLPYEAMVWRRYWEVFPLRDGPLPGCDAALHSSHGVEVERFSTPDGRLFTSRSYAIRGAEGAYFHSVHVISDVTDQSRAEAERNVLSKAVHQAGDAIAMVDRELRFNYVNPAFSRLFGYTLEELKGQSLQVIAPMPEELATDPASITNSIVERGEWRGEVRRQAKSGEGLLLHLTAAGLYGEQGELDGFILNYLDLRPIRTTQKQLHASEERFQRVVQAVPGILYRAELPSFDIGFISPAIQALLGYAPAEFQERPELWTEMICPSEREAVMAKILRALTDGETDCTVECRLCRKDTHAPIWFENRLRFARNAQGHAQAIFGVLSEISDRKRHEKQLEKLNRSLCVLSGINEALLHSTNERSLLRNVCRLIVHEGQFTAAWVGYKVPGPSQAIKIMGQEGYEPGYLERLPLTWGEEAASEDLPTCPVGHVIQSADMWITRDIPNRPELRWCADAARIGYESLLALPIRDVAGDAGVFGGIAIYASGRDAFDDKEISLLEQMADDLGFGISSLRTRAEKIRLAREELHFAKRLKNAFIGTIEAVSKLLEKRDPYTAGHQQRVARLAVAIGEDLDFEKDRLEWLSLGAHIHDIGKIALPAEILNRPGALSNTEFELIKSHPEIGYEIVDGIDFPWPVADIVLNHHERMDGSGYPRGLKGAAISLEARVIAVADVVEAMSSHRPYRPSLGMDAALEEIARNKDTLYDGLVAESCLRLIRRGVFRWD